MSCQAARVSANVGTFTPRRAKPVSTAQASSGTAAMPVAAGANRNRALVRMVVAVNRAPSPV